MIKFIRDINVHDSFALLYEVLVNDDTFVFASNRRLTTEDIANFLECKEEEIMQIDFSDYE